jgi:hypothetical protein
MHFVVDKDVNCAMLPYVRRYGLTVEWEFSWNLLKLQQVFGFVWSKAVVFAR